VTSEGVKKDRSPCTRKHSRDRRKKNKRSRRSNGQGILLTTQEA